MNHSVTVLLITCLGVAGLGATCPARQPEIVRERAIAIAQSQVSFEAAEVVAEKATEDGRRIWRVTVRGKPMSPDHPLLRAIVIALIDRRTGEVVSVAKS